MNINIRDSIEYQGIGGYVSENVRAIKCMDFVDYIYLPDNKPDIKEIIKVMGNIKALEGNLIRTATGKSLEGKILTGLKYQVDLIYKVRFEYIPVNFSTNIMTFDFINSIIDFINIPAETENDDIFIESAIIEDIYVELVNQRTIMLNTSTIAMVENKVW